MSRPRGPVTPDIRRSAISASARKTRLGCGSAAVTAALWGRVCITGLVGHPLAGRAVGAAATAGSHWRCVCQSRRQRRRRKTYTDCPISKHDAVRRAELCGFICIEMACERQPCVSYGISVMRQFAEVSLWEITVSCVSVLRTIMGDFVLFQSSMLFQRFLKKFLSCLLCTAYLALWCQTY